MAITLSDLLKMSQAQLDELFRQSPAGKIPEGEAKGTAIVAPGTTYNGRSCRVHQPLCMARQSF